MPDRIGPPHSFGWQCLRVCPNRLNLWETPTGYQVFLDKDVWLKQDATGLCEPIDAPAKSKYTKAPPRPPLVRNRDVPRDHA